MSGDLSADNTLRVPCTADRLLRIDREQTLSDLVAARRSGPRDASDPLTILGGGSNVVLRRRVAGTVCLMRTRGCQIVEGARGTARVTAAAGERWHDLVRRTLGGGWAGLENLALIPGSVGAAPIQNIGAYGVELADRLLNVRALDRDSGRVRELDRDACRFGYRDSVFKRPEGAGLIVLDVTVEVVRRPEPVVDYPDLQRELGRLGWLHPTPAQVAEAVIRVRRRKLPDPRLVGNVGSFFKNPVVPARQAAQLRRGFPQLVRRAADGGRVKLSAAQLIDACGWKGRRVGGVVVWHRQPLVLCNQGGASGRDILAVSEDIRRDVARRFDVELTLEPRVLGRD